jgi:hypothetical protein
MMGIGNYYAVEITRLSSLNKWHYFLYYSCLKTLAHKQKSSIAKIITKYGYLDISDTKRKNNPNHQKTAYNRRIVIKYQLQNQQPKYFTLLNYKEFMMKVSKLRERYRPKFSEIFNPKPIDFNLLKKVNWRTKFKLTDTLTTKTTVVKSNRNITIDENNKTYFNPELSKYLLEKEVVNQST